MSTHASEEIEHRTRYDDSYTPLVANIQPGDVVYLHYFGDHGHMRIHGVAMGSTDAPTTARIEGRYGGEYTLTDTGDGTIELEIPRELETIEAQSIYHLTRIPESVVQEADWREWEVHLCVSPSHESSDDQVLFPEAASQEQAITLAKRRANNDFPHVGPVYDEGNPPKTSTQNYDNSI